MQHDSKDMKQINTWRRVATAECTYLILYLSTAQLELPENSLDPAKISSLFPIVPSSFDQKT